MDTNIDSQEKLAGSQYLTFDETGTIVTGCDKSAVLVVIPDGVKTIDEFAFNFCSSLKSITIPNSVKSIGDCAFHKCTSLVSIKIPDSVKRIGHSAFHRCISLKSIILPSKLSILERDTFNECRSLVAVKLPECLISIKSGTFKSCISISSIVIPWGITGIDPETFLNCEKLKNIIIPDSVKKIGEAAFCGCSSLASITIPESVTEIEDRAFWGCSQLKDIQIPNSVKKVGELAFYECSSLASIVIPESVTEIEHHAFACCSQLKDIQIPNSVEKIGDFAFLHCNSLRDIKLPKGLKTIGSRAFLRCSSLEKLIAPTCIEQIHIEDCENLHELIVDKNNSLYTTINGIICNKNDGKPIFYPKMAKNIIIPEGVEEIHFGVFSRCTSLISLSLHRNVKWISIGAFDGCSNLQEFIVDKDNPYFCAIDGILYTKDGKKIICCPKSLKSIVIPDNIIEIGYHAFKGCASLKSITVPRNVTSIETGAFAKCDKLEEILVDENNTSFKSINGILYSADGTVLIAYPAGKKKSVQRVPKNVSEIASEAFTGCGLSSIKFSDNVKYIGESMFSFCPSLKYIKFPDCKFNIAELNFAECSSLKRLVIPDVAYIDMIDEFAFNNCSSLKEIDIPKSIVRICSNAFNGCYNLNKIKLHHTNPQDLEIDEDAFGMLYECILYVPTGCSELYRNDKRFKPFVGIGEIGSSLTANTFERPKTDIPEYDETRRLFRDLKKQLHRKSLLFESTKENNHHDAIVEGKCDSDRIVMYIDSYENHTCSLNVYLYSPQNIKLWDWNRHFESEEKMRSELYPYNNAQRIEDSISSSMFLYYDM